MSDFDLFADVPLASRQHEAYLDRHRLALKQVPEIDAEPSDPPAPDWVAWSRVKTHPDHLTREQADHLATSLDATWGYTPTEALAAFAKLKGLPLP